MKKVYYEKIGRKYVPVSEYDSEFNEGFHRGDHLVSVYPGGASYRYNIEPAFAPLIAAGRYAEDAISKAIMKASDMRPTKVPLTQEQRDAWEKLSQAFGEDSHLLQWPSIQDAARAGVTALQTEADVLLSNPAVKNAYEEFMLICKLTKETK